MYEKKPGTFIKHIDFLVLDMVLLFISFWGAYIIRHHSFYFYLVPFDDAEADSRQIMDNVLKGGVIA